MSADRRINGLLIEDDPDDALLLMQSMARAGHSAIDFTFECAETLASGLEMLGKSGIEVILLDLMLPDSRGLDTLVKVRSRAPDIPIVVLTGLSDESMGLEALKQGAQDYQVKGQIDAHALQRTIRYAVERHRLLTGLKNLIDKAADGMVVMDGAGVVLYLNSAAEALFNMKAEAMVGRPLPYRKPKDDGGELKIPAADGTERIAEMRLAEVEWNDRSAQLASIRDITELRRIEQLKAEVKEGRRMDKLKDELMSAVSHEMRSPLAIVKAVVSSLKDGLAGALSEKQSELISLCDRNVARLQKIVDNILDLSRLESGKAKISPRFVDANRLIRDTTKGFRLLALDQNIAIAEELPAGSLFIHADPELFAQVLSNLLDNAMRFAHTKIAVKAKVMGNSGQRRYVQFSVVDDGQGIPTEKVGELFNKFVQVNRSTTPGEGYKGTGLGLAICRQSVERQNGKIWVESSEGRGAQFHFVLPCADANPTTDKEGRGAGGRHAER